MGFVNTGNTNTLELNLTDRGKALIGGGGGGLSLFTTLASSKFALRYQGMDYRRFSTSPVPGASDTTTNGPCYDQQYSVNPYMERLSGTCFFNYADIRGRGSNAPCNKTVLLENDIMAGGPYEDLGINDNLLYLNEPGIPSVPEVEEEEVIPPPPPACFDLGYDSTFGQQPNPDSCACTTYGTVWEPLIGESENIFNGWNMQETIAGGYNPALGWTDSGLTPANTQGGGWIGFAYYYPSYEAVMNVILNLSIQNNTPLYQLSGAFGPAEGMFAQGATQTQLMVTDTGGIVGDVYGDGSLACSDLSWAMKCHCQGVLEGDVTPTPSYLQMQNIINNVMDSYIVAVGCNNNVPSSMCDGTMAQCQNPAICAQ